MAAICPGGRWVKIVSWDYVMIWYMLGAKLTASQYWFDNAMPDKGLTDYLRIHMLRGVKMICWWVNQIVEQRVSHGQ